MNQEGTLTNISSEAQVINQTPTQVHPAITGMGGLSIVKQLLLMLALAATVAIGVAVVFWSQAPNLRPVYSGVDGADLAAMADILEDNKIAYEVRTSEGVLLIESDKVDLARIKLASAGLPSVNYDGYELLEKDSGFSTSQFLEKARYHRAMEGELSRTISSMAAVKSARVHLAIPRQRVFIGDQRKPSASVFIELYSGAHIEKQRVAAIVHLVASAVPELAHEQVTVVDGEGRLLSDDNETVDGAELSNKQFEYSQKVESAYRKRIADILIPYLGDEGFQVQVSVDMDFTQLEQTSEQFNPDFPALRSEHTVEENVSQAGHGGVPGALENVPAEAGTTEPPAEGENAAGQGSASNRATRNYELDRTISHKRYQYGQVQRVTAAVAIDYQLVTTPPAAEGEEPQQTKQPLDEESLQKVRSLVEQAMGFNAARGDRLTVQSVPFALQEALPVAEVAPIWEQGWFWSIIKQVLAGLFIIVLVFKVLKPAMNKLTEQGESDVANGSASLELSSAKGVDGQLHQANNNAALPPGAAPLALSYDGPAAYEEKIDAARQLVNEDPRRVAQVVKAWAHADET